MVYNIQNYFFFFYFVHHPVFEKLENTTFGKLDQFPSSDEWETPTLLGPLERSTFSHWTTRIRIITAI
jgi:hypothetical protein